MIRKKCKGFYLGTYFKICYAVWIVVCVIWTIAIFATHNAILLGDILVLVALIIAPYLYFLCVFKLPVDFEIWCKENGKNINDFVAFAKKYVAWLCAPFVLVLVFFMAKAGDFGGFFVVLPALLWLYVVLLKKMLCFCVDRFLRGRFRVRFSAVILSLLCICSICEVAFMIRELKVVAQKLCSIEYDFKIADCIQSYQALARIELYCMMIVCAIIFSVLWIKRGEFALKGVNLLYIWFGGTQCAFLAILAVFY